LLTEVKMMLKSVKLLLTKVKLEEKTPKIWIIYMRVRCKGEWGRPRN